MKLVIHKPSDKQIGNVRVSDAVFSKIEELAEAKGVTNQAIIRAVLEQVIYKVEI